MSFQIGLIGRGRFGVHYERLIPTLAGVTLAGVVEDASGVSGLLGNRSIDAVVIATPTATHEALAAAAFRNGKHVLLEKPMAPTLAAAERIGAAARAAGTLFMLGHQFLYNDEVRRLQAAIASGAIGAPRFFFGEQFAPGPVPDGVGCFFEMATHELAILDFLAHPGELLAASGVSSGTRGREDAAAVVLSFASGLAATVAVSWSAPEKTRMFLVIGTRGGVRYDDRTAPKPTDPLRNQLEHFVSCIRTGAAPQTGLEHALKNTRWLEQCAAAMAHPL